jgi:hypothetical protein
MRPWNNASDSDLQTYESISRVFFKYPYLLDSFFERDSPKIRCSPEQMLKWASGFSNDEIVLVKTALDIWSGSGNTYVWELIELLDKDSFYFVLHALAILRRNRL